MKRTVLLFGLVSGAIGSALAFLTASLLASGEYGTSDFLGYTSMALSGLLVFFGVRSYRERAGGGRLRFGRGLAVGALISLVASLLYAGAFQVLYFQVRPDFGDTFERCMIDRAQAGGASPEEVEKAKQTARTLKDLYDRPATNALLSLGTTFPLGVVFAAISAAVLRRKGATRP